MIKVSIICITYNHVDFIRQALDSFVMQKTNFPFEVIVHDDASTDGTTEIIKEYEKKYPDIIKPIYQKENQWKQGKTMSKTFIYPKIRGYYVIFCEGDDYWIDENKLQKQVDFLDTHPDFSICFHPVIVHYEDKSVADKIFPTKEYRFNKEELNIQDLLKHNFIQTNSVMYRWRFHKENINLIPDNILPGDYFLHLLHAQIGKIKFLPDIMSVYRKHSRGIWFGAGQSDNWFIKCGLKHINFYKKVEETFNISKENDIYWLILMTYYAAIKLNNNNLQEKLKNEYPWLKNPSKLYIINIIYITVLRILYILTFKRYKKIKIKYKALKNYIKTN